MIVLPIPAIVALVLGFLFVRSLIRGETQRLLLILIASCAVQSLIVALAQHYEFAALRPVMPVTAALIPLITWLAFVQTAYRSLSWQRDGWHLLGPLLVLTSRVLAPQFLDIAIPAIFAGYGIAILLAMVPGDDSLPRSHLGSGSTPLRLWQIIATLLIVSAIGDVLIAADHLFATGTWRPLLITLMSSLNLLALGVVALSSDLGGSPESTDAAELPPGPSIAEGSARPEADPSLDTELMSRLEWLMRDRQPFLDPDLTLAQLARKLTVPAKQLSATINRTTGGNVSRHINGYRIEHACRLLAAGHNITAAMLESGFNTKSNFNREFQRVKSLSPSEWVDRCATTNGQPHPPRRARRA